MPSFARTEPVSFRPLALPVEHGGWGILLEPVALAMLVTPSRAGALIAAAAFFAFLARHPLKLAMQDALRGHAFARTMWCWIFAAWYGVLATYCLVFALAQSRLEILIPFATAAPLAIVMLVQDVRRRSRSLVPEIAGAIAMASVAASIAIASRASYATAFTLMLLIALRSVPTIVYVRALLGRTSRFAAIALHVLAIAIAALLGLIGAMAAYAALLARAAWGLTHETPPAKTIGWREIAWGVVTIALVALTPP